MCKMIFFFHFIFVSENDCSVLRFMQPVQKKDIDTIQIYKLLCASHIQCLFEWKAITVENVSLMSALPRQAKQIQFPFVAIRRWNNFFSLFLHVDLSIAHIDGWLRCHYHLLSRLAVSVSSNNCKNGIQKKKEERKKTEPTTNWKTF